LVRYLDYTLDYYTGELIFRLPVDATDAEFNPNVIVVDYETSEDAERNITAGGRVQAQFMDDKLQVGTTFTHENGSALAAGAQSNQIGVDVIAQLSDTTQLRAEYAVTDQANDGEGVADAKLLEIVHTSENLLTEAYFREEDGNFGLGQTASNTNGVRRYGLSGALNVQESEHGITVQASAETPIDGLDEVSAQPQRLMLGVDKRVGNVAVVNLRHELLNGGGQNSVNTTLGLTATPWSGGTATAAADNLTNDSGRRLGATVGLDHTVRLTEKVSGQLGIRARRLLRAEDKFVEVAPDAVISPVESNEDRNEDTVIFNRLDIINSQPSSDVNTTKLVNNAAMNNMLTDRWQLSSNIGTKFVQTELSTETVSNWTHLLGAETRFDVTERIDLGLRGSLLTNKEAGTSYSWGPSVGVSPVDNVWISAGYNVQGFKDNDFEAAEYARKGAYLQLRIKFDQDTARGLLRRISPNADTLGPVEERQILSTP